jgi:endonuclease/exonuclease/phosphatase family metal-dependent hydrolase
MDIKLTKTRTIERIFKTMKILICTFIFIMPVLIAQDIDDLYFGTDSTFEVMTWNLEWFPKNGQITADYVSQIIEALNIDLLAIQEVDDTVIFSQMVANLPGYSCYFESEWFAGLAYIYKTDVIEINDIYEIYTTSPYWSAFPRSPMVMDLNFMGENIKIINNHFKCCGDGVLELNNPNDEEMRRYTAINLLREYIDEYFSTDNVIVLGDLNDVLTDVYSNNVFQLVINDSENFLFTDIEIAEGLSSNWSYPSWPSHIDHILITNELTDEFELVESEIQTIKIDDYMDGGFNDYDDDISDHRPVALKLSFSNTVYGDVNEDGLSNIIDILIIVNLVLTDNFNTFADVNNDAIVNVIDILLIVNIILDI